MKNLRFLSAGDHRQRRIRANRGLVNEAPKSRFRISALLTLILMAWASSAYAATCDLRVSNQYQSPTRGFVIYDFTNLGPDTCDAFVQLGASRIVASNPNDLTTYGFKPDGWAGNMGGSYSTQPSGDHAAQCAASGAWGGLPSSGTPLYWWSCTITALAPGEKLRVSASVPPDEPSACPAAAIGPKAIRQTGLLLKTYYYTPDTSGSITDPDVDNNYGSEACQPGGGGNYGEASVKLTKVASSQTVPTGAPISWTIKATASVLLGNPAGATGVTVTDTLPRE
jgi:hypothetical protein